MSTFILPPGYTHHTFAIHHASVARRALITFAGKVAAPPFIQSDADSVALEVSEVLKGQADNEVTMGDVVTLVGDDGPPSRYVSITGGSGGGGSGEVCPPNVALLFQKQTGLSGRRYRGRAYWPFVFEAAVSQAGAVAPAHITSWTTTLGLVLALFNGAEGLNLDGMVLLHSQAPSLPTPVTSLTISPWAATQRHRMRRGL